MIIYQSEHATLKWVEAHHSILKRFRGFIKDQELQDAFNTGLKVLKEHHSCKWLSDNRGLPVYRPQDIEWINHDWFPRMLAAGWKYWALLEPETAIGAMTMKKFQFYVDQGITLQVFATEDEGFAWLDSLPC